MTESVPSALLQGIAWEFPSLPNYIDDRVFDNSTVWDRPISRQSLTNLDPNQQIRIATYNVHNWSSKEDFTSYNFDWGTVYLPPPHSSDRERVR